jgi:hypothetical protein
LDKARIGREAQIVIRREVDDRPEVGVDDCTRSTADRPKDSLEILAAQSREVAAENVVELGTIDGGGCRHA